MPDEINQCHVYGDIAKFESLDDGSIIVEGIASSEVRDHDGEVITADAMRKAIPAYMTAPAVREMHQPIAAGRMLSAFVDENGETHVRAKIVDKGTIQKIKDKVLRGFSIFGSALKREGNKITELVLKTIDVVDLPNNPKSLFSIAKFDKPGDACTDPQCKNHHESAIEKCSICKSKMAKAETTNPMTTDELAKFDALTKTVEGLAKSIETLSKATPTAPPELAKALSDIGDLKKVITDTQAKQLEIERAGIISKMQSEGRVVIGEDGVAVKPDDLQKMDLPVLKVLARNATLIPLSARAKYFGGSPDDVKKFVAADGKTPLTGDELVEAGMEAAGYDDLNKMIARATKN